MLSEVIEYRSLVDGTSLTGSLKDSILITTSRFRQVCTFGRGTIRRFSANVSGLKKLAARDYEDILQVRVQDVMVPLQQRLNIRQCIIPCIAGLITPPSRAKAVLDFLWEAASRHALAKLRLHSETTVRILEASTNTLGKATRDFAAACDDLNTRELPSEDAARGRREDARASRGDAKGKAPLKSGGSKRKTLNLKTFKYHDRSHTADCIRSGGTTDCYSTQTVRFLLSHLRLKTIDSSL